MGLLKCIFFYYVFGKEFEDIGENEVVFKVFFSGVKICCLRLFYDVWVDVNVM